MLAYIRLRLLLAIPVVFGVSVLVFASLYLLPGQIIQRNNFYDAKIKGVKNDARGIYLWLYDAYVES
jgi:ABC-type dipeptide/oligopeptide/nickel transport system permease component